jgi:DNA repair exonuclease SbcCD ATPase subunit
MKKLILLIAFFAIAITGVSVISAQENQQQTTTSADSAKGQVQSTAVYRPKPFPEDISLADQFAYAIDKSSNFQDYKTIKMAWMSKLRTNTLDTLNRLKTDIKNVSTQIQQKNKDIEALQTDLGNVRTELKEKNSFSFFGILVSKSGYDSIMWGIIICLIVALGFAVAAYRRSISVTNQTKKDLDEIKVEFETFRKKALKSKEEAVRQLYDELQKYKGKK